MLKLEKYREKRQNVDWSSYCSPVASETQLDNRSEVSSSADEHEEALFRELNDLCGGGDVRLRQTDEGNST